MQYRTRKLLSSKWRRALRWEFWPMPVFYFPIVLYIFYLCARYRGLTFLSVNPGLPMSGLIGERKAATLQQLNGSEFLARFKVLTSSQDLETRFQHAQRFMRKLDLSYPIVMKPDFGQRGQGVEVVRNDKQMRNYLASARNDTILQEHIPGEEFGLFYLRYPEQEQGEIFSITEKTFPILVGDGEKNLEQLIMDNPRTHYMAKYLLELHQDKLTEILANEERFKVVEIGSHCRGSVFLDGNRYITGDLRQQIDSLSRNIEGFYFGRYDIRVVDKRSLQAGQSFKVLEVNGVTSESTNVYDPKNSVFDAYKILFRQWRAAFEIGKQNISNGEKQFSILELLRHLRITYC